ncbi:MAG TPA: proton-conducting transporter membrane subunit, partial [Burkholderiales bacterium]|nr:proton-conducting transporter membrane subunit [Burkholderiales bacterium]
MEYEIPDFLLAAPEIILLTMVCVILVVDLFLSDARRVWTYALSQLSLVGTAALVFVMGGEDVAYTFNGMFVDDPMADVLKIAVCLTVAVMLAYSRAYVAARDMYRGEFFVLSLFATLGMMVMISANHFLVLYLGLELLSLSLYAMVALPRDSGNSTEAAMKYFVLGALASGM